MGLKERHYSLAGRRSMFCFMAGESNLSFGAAYHRADKAIEHIVNLLATAGQNGLKISDSFCLVWWAIQHMSFSRRPVPPPPAT